MVQRKTQTVDYWQKLDINSEDVEVLFNMLLDAGEPQTTPDLALALIQHRCQEEEISLRADVKEGTLYQPQGSFQQDEDLVFSRFDYAAGTVVGERAGHNPRYGDFSVIQVDFGQPAGVREFAADFSHPHSLNMAEGQSLAEVEGALSPTELFRLYADFVTVPLTETLEANPEFVRFREEWLLKGLLAPIHDGLLNIVEAAIDINGQALTPEDLLKELDFSDELPLDVQIFSLNATLQADSRFVNVGPLGQVRWDLRQMEPPDIDLVPLHLILPQLQYDVNQLDGELRRLLGEIDDEATDPSLIPAPAPDVDSVTVILNYPHRSSGTLPITPKTAAFFPQADDHHVRITLIDEHSGESMPAWVVSQHQYVLGLGEWYAQHQLPVGTYISLQQTDMPLTIKLGYRPVRASRKWIRGAVAQGGRIAFQNVRQLISCEYDDFMVVGEDDPAALGLLWEKHSSQNKPLSNLLRQVALELIKLNPQGNVHAKTLYSAINVVRRCPPAAIFCELSAQTAFVPMGHGYWIYDATKDN